MNADQSGDVTVLRPTGRIDNDSSAEFQSALIEYMQESGARIVIDFSRVEYISSAGLRVLMSAARKSKTSSGRLVVAAPTAVVQEIFEISRFSHVLEIFDAMEDALAELS